MESVAELLAARAGDGGVGLRFEEDSWTWAEVVAESVRRAALLEALRRPGPFHVGVLLENVPEFLFLLGGAALSGATLVGINPTRRGEELARDVRHTDCQLVITGREQAGLLEGLDLGVDPDRVLTVGSGPYGALIGEASGAGIPDPVPGPEALYLLLFTSGSTGAPKAVRVSQGRMAGAGLAMARGSGFGSGDVLYCAMPMFHGNALNSCVIPAVASGATLVLRRRFSATGFLPDIQRFGATYFNYVGRALAYILAVPPALGEGENRLKFAFGTEASPADMKAFRARFGCPVVEGYGSSEGAFNMSRVPGTPRNALGKAPDSMDIAVVDPATLVECPRAVFDEGGRLCNASEAIGEMVARDGVGRFEGYWANEEADAARTREGWFWSGDLGYRDAEGFFYFAGRPADWLRVDGENFAAAPVERVLARFPGVVTAAVYPVPDAATGDQVMVTLELLEGETFDPDGFVRFLGDQTDLGTKWAPRYVRVGRVPLTGSNKVDKGPLRAARWTTEDPVWWRLPGETGYRPMVPADWDAVRAEFEAQGRLGVLEV